MCFKTPKPPAPPPEDPSLKAARDAAFAEQQQRLRDEKDGVTDDSRAKAYGFYGIRSLLGSGSGGLLRPK